MIDLVGILFDWHVLLVAGCLLVILPVVFFISSLDKTPVKIKRIIMKRAGLKTMAQGQAAGQPPRREADEQQDDDVVPEPRGDRRRSQ